jgi:hypothetical protein
VISLDDSRNIHALLKDETRHKIIKMLGEQERKKKRVTFITEKT